MSTTATKIGDALMSQLMAQLGRSGGTKRMAGLTKAQKRRLARKAARMRWGTKRTGKMSSPAKTRPGAS